ncbi:hypothetical protein Anapl_09206 [Anas platyrhynchos]|uniref:Uncharacterized protein n=1 Tax=Anas platyrhynchos TaxID=8839 RepID=R0JL36_ANAPL|nr:hypothetical protein Anapl_09206 [Anas platyrhynchos]
MEKATAVAQAGMKVESKHVSSGRTCKHHLRKYSQIRQNKVNVRGEVQTEEKAEDAAKCQGVQTMETFRPGKYLSAQIPLTAAEAAAPEFIPGQLSPCGFKNLRQQASEERPGLRVNIYTNADS